MSFNKNTTLLYTDTDRGNVLKQTERIQATSPSPKKIITYTAHRTQEQTDIPSFVSHLMRWSSPQVECRASLAGWRTLNPQNLQFE